MYVCGCVPMRVRMCDHVFKANGVLELTHWAMHSCTLVFVQSGQMYCSGGISMVANVVFGE